MSGLYNMLMGNNPFIPYLLGCIGITEETKDQYPLGRFRDVGVSEDGKTVFVLTRNYGEEWEHVDEALATNPNFREKVAESDETYSTYLFDTPTETLEVTQKIAELSDTGSPFERYLKAIKDFGEGKENEQTKHMMEVGKKIVEPLVKTIQDGENTSEVVESGGGAVHIIGMKGGKTAALDEDIGPKDE